MNLEIKAESWLFWTMIVWQRFCEPARLRIAYCPWLAGWLSCPTSHIKSYALSDKWSKQPNNESWEVSQLVIIGY